MVCADGLITLNQTDGSLYVSEDNSGRIYRIFYNKKWLLDELYYLDQEILNKIGDANN